MHHEHGGQTASAHRDRIHHERGQALHDEHHHIRRRRRSVQDLVVECERQRVHGHVIPHGDGIVRSYSPEDVVGEHAAVHERRGEKRDETADSSVTQHHVPVFDLGHGSPISRDMLDAQAYVVHVRQQRAILKTRQQPVAERTELAHLGLHVLAVVQEDAQRARHEGADDQKYTHHQQNVRQNSLFDGRIRHWPGADRLQQPTNRLYAVLYVVRVARRCDRGFPRVSLHVRLANARIRLNRSRW